MYSLLLLTSYISVTETPWELHALEFPFYDGVGIAISLGKKSLIINNGSVSEKLYIFMCTKHPIHKFDVDTEVLGCI